MRQLFHYHIFLLLTVGTVFIDAFATTNCSSNAECGANGICSRSNICTCTKDGYVTVSSNKPCEHVQKEKLTVFLLSFFVGILGVDWFYLANGNAVYILAGVFKLLTIGGCGVWAIVDWIRILTNTFPDGQGIPLNDWT